MSASRSHLARDARRRGCATMRRSAFSTFGRIDGSSSFFASMVARSRCSSSSLWISRRSATSALSFVVLAARGEVNALRARLRPDVRDDRVHRPSSGAARRSALVAPSVPVAHGRAAPVMPAVADGPGWPSCGTESMGCRCRVTGLRAAPARGCGAASAALPCCVDGVDEDREVADDDRRAVRDLDRVAAEEEIPAIVPFVETSSTRSMPWPALTTACWRETRSLSRRSEHCG